MKKRLLNILPVLSVSMILCLPLDGRANQEIDNVVENTGLSGSYLAARVATADNDDLAAVSFLQKSLELDPDNNQIKRNLFHGYLASGRIEDAVLLGIGTGKRGWPPVGTPRSPVPISAARCAQHKS